MRFRKLRTAWSVFWGLACVLLIVLWVRSVGAEDRLTGHFSGSHVFRIYSSRSCLVYYVPSPPGPASSYAWRAVFGSEFWLQVSDSRVASAPQVHVHAQEKWITLPYWLLADYVRLLPLAHGSTYDSASALC